VRKPKLDKRRVLIVTGILSENAFRLSKEGLPESLPSNSITVFTGYSLAEFPIGQQFTKVFLLDDIDSWSELHCEIVAVTQQWNRPFDAVPEGWKTICVLKFHHYIPDLVRSLPLSNHDTWLGSSESYIGLLDDETWQQLLSESTTSASGGLKGDTD
jgi:hypothetical protein